MRALLWSVMRWFLFRIDAETAHLTTLALIRLGIRLGGWPLRIASGGGSVVRPEEVLGLSFRSPVGLAAGFDKNAEILAGLPALGFGFAEIGTVTPRPQPGNSRPRLFRDLERRGVFNRMGFNSLGATIVAERLAEARSKLPPDFRVGVNVGKNKDTALENAGVDYVRAITPFRGLCDYAVINVSSPNTPGLRSLQAVEPLRPIVEGVAQVLAGWPKRPPLLLKLAPEVLGSGLTELLTGLERWGIDGWVLTNTLAGTYPFDAREVPDDRKGGWSGEPLREAARRSLAEARAATRLPIISVGGIMSADEARARLDGGASLVQLYTGWIYEGPEFPRKIAEKMQKKSPKPEAQGYAK